MKTYKERICEWIEKLLSEGTPTEVVSFLEEIPIRVKTKILNFDKKDEFVEWEICPRLEMALRETKQLYIPFLDPAYNVRRMLVADVIYASRNMAETTFPRPFDDPKFRREHLRVKTSRKLPLKVKISERHSVEARDISEGGIGLYLKKGALNVGNVVNLNITFPDGKEFQVRGEVVHLEGKDTPVIGIKFLNPPKAFLNAVTKYIMKRQRELMENLKLLSE